MRKEYKPHTVDAATVRVLFTYDPDTGVMRHAQPASPLGGPRRADDAPIGLTNRYGYLRHAIDGKEYLVHRLVWLYQTGEWPRQNIDHIDGCKTNNRWSNLRDVSDWENLRGARNPRKGKTLPVGVMRVPDSRVNPFCARIALPYNTNALHLGCFPSVEAAEARYLAAREIILSGLPNDEAHRRIKALKDSPYAEA